MVIEWLKDALEPGADFSGVKIEAVRAKYSCARGRFNEDYGSRTVRHNRRC
ncbi:MAG: hypothetical protein ACXV5P_03180 [Halobacteriota archaeon]